MPRRRALAADLLAAAIADGRVSVTSSVGVNAASLTGGTRADTPLIPWRMPGIAPG